MDTHNIQTVPKKSSTGNQIKSVPRQNCSHIHYYRCVPPPFRDRITAERPSGSGSTPGHVPSSFPGFPWGWGGRPALWGGREGMKSLPGAAGLYAVIFVFSGGRVLWPLPTIPMNSPDFPTPALESRLVKLTSLLLLLGGCGHRINCGGSSCRCCLPSASGLPLLLSIQPTAHASVSLNASPAQPMPGLACTLPNSVLEGS